MQVVHIQSDILHCGREAETNAGKNDIWFENIETWLDMHKGHKNKQSFKNIHNGLARKDACPQV